MLITELIILLVLLVLAIAITKFILSFGKLSVQILVHLIMGWITLAIVNIIPGINVPINLLTVLISGFGGIAGTFIVVLFTILF